MVIKVAVVLAFIAFGAAYINRANWEPFIPADGRARATSAGAASCARAGVIFFAYIGFDAVSTAAQEAKNPQRDMPIGILGSLVICTVLYIAVSLVLTGIVELHPAQRARPDRRRHQRRRPRPGLAPAVRQDRRHRRALVGDPGDAAGPAAHLLHDVARTGCCRRSSARCTRSSRRRGSPRS